MSIRVHIDRLVLDGVELGPGGGVRLQAAVELELTRLMRGGGFGANLSSAAVPQVAVNSISMDSNPSRLGAQVALSVYEGLKR